MTDAILPRFGSGLGRAEAKSETEDTATNAAQVRHVVACAEDAATFLKALGHEGRLLILCHLLSGEKSVTELENLLSSRQAAVSQQLARLRLEGMVQTRRDGQQIYYSILDPRAAELVKLLDRQFRASRDSD